VIILSKKILYDYDIQGMRQTSKQDKIGLPKHYYYY